MTKKIYLEPLKKCPGSVHFTLLTLGGCQLAYKHWAVAKWHKNIGWLQHGIKIFGGCRVP